MSLSLAGLGLLSLRRPFAHFALLAKFDLHSLFLLLVFLVVICVLAYLTNPSEVSFRAYLTELSFRQHLSRLDDGIDDSASPDAEAYSSANCHPSSSLFEHRSPFHFANCASVSLRTPKHVFHSFGLFTIAAIVPVPKPQSSSDSDRDGSVVSDSWFIGAFGKWWRGGTLEAWYHDVLATSKDEQRWNPGILCFKSSDKKHADCPGLPFTTKMTPAAPKRLRHRERSSHRTSILPRRNSTPPPLLPKSASLPLHASRPPPATAPRPSPLPSHPSSQTVVHTSDSPVLLAPSSTPSRRPSASSFDQSPQIKEVQRQISLTKSTVLDLRIQLTDAQSAASTTHLALETEVEACRENKRQEDAARLELKSRTKALEDSKRQAEGTKRDAEKKLKATQHARDDAQQRIQHLDTQIAQLRQRLLDDKALALANQEELAAEEDEITHSLELKRREAKVAEDVVAALSQRARELEEKLAADRERLRLAKEQVELRKQDRSFFPLTVVSPPQNSTTWPTLPFRSPTLERQQQQQQQHRSPDSHQSSPRPTKLSLTGISNFDGFPSTNQRHTTRKGYAIFEEDLASLKPQSLLKPVSTFSPFDDDPLSPVPLVTPTSSTLIPSSLVSCMDAGSDGLSRSFQSENDVVMDRDWRSQHHLHASTLDNSLLSTTSRRSSMASSPTSLLSNTDHDLRVIQRRAMDTNLVESPGRIIDHDYNNNSAHLYRSNSDPTKSNLMMDSVDSIGSSLSKSGSSGRRWFMARDKEPKKGLNPDAKVFSLSTKPLTTTAFGVLGKMNVTQHAPPSPPPLPPLSSNCALANSASGVRYDALNPNGIGNMILSSNTSSNFLRAFAPSPAEREALQRALGGSTNASLERLPSLSDVGSIPSSPTLVHVPAAVVVPGGTTQRKGFPQWLQSLPLIRKPTTTFSPWEDEDGETTNSVVAVASGASRSPGALRAKVE